MHPGRSDDGGAEVAGVRGTRSQRTRVPQTTCVQNSRIILGKYLNVKLITHVVRHTARVCLRGLPFRVLVSLLLRTLLGRVFMSNALSSCIS